MSERVYVCAVAQCDYFELRQLPCVQWRRCHREMSEELLVARDQFFIAFHGSKSSRARAFGQVVILIFLLSWR